MIFGFRSLIGIILPEAALEELPSRAYDCQESSPMGWFSSHRSWMKWYSPSDTPTCKQNGAAVMLTRDMTHLITCDVRSDSGQPTSKTTETCKLKACETCGNLPKGRSLKGAFTDDVSTQGEGGLSNF